ncbi:metal ABC transporter substrate-binding protein [Corynebacterium epidermidicanis]|uniref:ABC-type metal ion transport system, periplasmic component/surface adhesin n=1 Tax=Corynebacterium epidermidicanis TaxID=1050174 RepID=A0A0G3GMP1_9CORY|nr:metal ABC transporter substrate-binding protein [Corynebacterium epidermidicanis]AKK02409.1 ABC-type metal ion transport system, periplasmic component/surface adhesin [Corynebacterium epidermidicanis]
MSVRGTKALIVASALALGGCSQAATQSHSSQPAALRVVATTTQICDYLTQLSSGVPVRLTDPQGKTHTSEQQDPKLDLTCILSPNASAHEHEMTAQQMAALATADVIFVNGVDLERFMDQAIESSGFHGKLAVTSGKDDTAQSAGKREYQRVVGTHKIDVAPWPFAPEPGEEAEFEFDPHVWTSPKGAMMQTRNIAEALAAESAGDVQWNAQAEPYLSKLADLDRWVQDSLQTVPREKRVLFTSHDAFGYFARDYDVDFIGSALSDFNAQQDATSQHIQAGVDQVRQAHAEVIFAENSNNAKSIEAIGRAAGVRVITGDEALYGDSLGPAGSDGATYIGSILHNVTNLVRAWGGTPAPLPVSLQPWAPKETIQ